MKTTEQIINGLNRLHYRASETTAEFRAAFANSPVPVDGRGEIAVYDDATGSWYACDRDDAESLLERLLAAETDADRYDAYTDWCEWTYTVETDDDSIEG